MGHQILKRHWGLFLVVVMISLAGCTTQKLSESATEFNTSFEQANNRMILLNIIRASMRRPMYFTSFSALHGGAGFVPGTTGMSIPFGPGATGSIANRDITPSLGYTPSTFDMTTLDGQDFMNGITTPVSMKQLEYFWSQGYPHELLWMLFVQKIEVTPGDTKLLLDTSKLPGHERKGVQEKYNFDIAFRPCNVQEIDGKLEFKNYPESETDLLPIDRTI
jgi:hypothetical protein